MGVGDNHLAITLPHSFSALQGGNIELNDQVERWAAEFMLQSQEAVDQFQRLPNGNLIYTPGSNRGLLSKKPFVNKITIKAATHPDLDDEIEAFTFSAARAGTYLTVGTNYQYSCNAVLTKVDVELKDHSPTIYQANIYLHFQMLDDFVAALITV